MAMVRGAILSLVGHGDPSDDDDCSMISRSDEELERFATSGLEFRFGMFELENRFLDCRWYELCRKFPKN